MTKIGNATLNETLTRDLEYQLYAEAMAASLRQNKPTTVRKLTPEEILAMQPESTRHAMTTDPEERWSKPIQRGWKAHEFADFGTEEGRDIAVGKRQLRLDEVLIAQDLRHKSRNELGDSDDSSVSKEKREQGIHAFTYSKPVDLSTLSPGELKKITRLEEIKSTPIEPPQEAPIIKKSTLSKVGSAFLFVVDMTVYPIDWVVRRIFHEEQ